jgi:hydrogenase maturation protease
MTPHILLAGVGNIFLGDDGFGVAVAQRLQYETLPAEVRVRDFGIRGFDLALALLEGYETAVLIDATQRGGPPGSLYVIELDGAPAGSEEPANLHTMHLDEVFRLVGAWGGRLPRLFLVGCEPAALVRDGSSGVEPALSPAVERALDEAVLLVRSLIGRLLQGEGLCNRVN